MALVAHFTGNGPMYIRPEDTLIGRSVGIVAGTAIGLLYGISHMLFREGWSARFVATGTKPRNLSDQ